MKAEPHIHFPPFHLDLATEQLWREEQPLPLRPKPFAILRYLAEHPGRLVTKEELLKAVWPDTYVGEGLLNTYIRDLRRVLGDEPAAPRFIATVVRRGYRFIAAVQSQDKSGVRSQNTTPVPNLVGREAELAQLHEWLEKALQGERQLVFVTGEPGIGKTTVVEAFLAHLGTATDVWIGRGQCIEHHGAGEAYMPVLEALRRLCREPGGERLLALLNQYAPTWLVQLPALLSADDLEALQRKVQGATRERMLREMAEAVEALTVERPLVLWLEDLHWSDASTLDLLAVLARRRESARLLVIGTYRPLEMLGDGHPLNSVTQELHGHRLCAELAPRLLTAADIAAYLNARFPESALPTGWAQALSQRTGGNPLFLVSAVEDLVARGVMIQVDGCWTPQSDGELVEAGVPENIRQLIARQGARLLPAEQQTLEAASLAGMEFSAAAAAAVLEADVVEVEERCADLASRQQFLRPAGISEWPDGTVAARYGFLHAFYQQFWHERVSAGRLQRLQLRIGKRKEAAYGAQAGKIAAELAVHFEQGRDYRRAIQYLQQAAQRASDCSANVEVIRHLTKGLELLKTLPETPECTQQELTLQIALGGPLMATKGYTAPEAEQAYARARELCRQVGETPQLFPVLWGLNAFYGTRGESQTANELGEQMLRLAQSVQDPALLLMAHRVRGATLYFRGELVPALEHLEQGIALYDRQQHHSLAFRYVTDPGMHCLSYAAGTLWHLGYPDQALNRVHEALTLAQELSHPNSLAYALTWAARVHQLRKEEQAAQERAEATITLSTEQGLPFFLATETILRGWALAEQGQGEEGIAEMRQGLAAYRATG
ncbi:MAG: AAA family ATPase, partial [Deltaproteobacteria bacterium]|nr:AAA family ATPase [Deltaproteobacteria bacterium]